VNAPPLLPTLGQRLADQARAAVAWVRGVALFVKLVVVAGGACLSGAARFAPLPSAPLDVKDIVGIVGIVGVTAAFVGAVALLFLDRGLADSLKLAADSNAELQTVLVKAAHLGAELAEAEVRDRRHRALRAAASALRDVLEKSLRRSPPDEPALMQEMLDVALGELQSAMGVLTGDIWTISIYRADPGLKPVLRRVATRRSNRAEEIQPSRDWGPGQGHIGMTYVHATEVVLEDVADAGIRHLLHAPADKEKASDASRYRSIAAVPVVTDGADEPWGVVIATSSRAGQFSPTPLSEGAERAEAMRVFSGLIALAVSIQHMKHEEAQRAASPTQQA
jgi:hypothetical protein